MDLYKKYFLEKSKYAYCKLKQNSARLKDIIWMYRNNDQLMCFTDGLVDDST